eukprot:5454931-Pyramimonas_sp.AAC.1
MRTPPLGPSVELFIGPRSAVLGGGTHASTAAGVLSGTPYGDMKRCAGQETHADTVTEVFSGDPYGAT